MSDLFEIGRDRSSQSLEPEIRLFALHFGNFLICKSFIGRGRFRRSPSQAAADGIDHFVLTAMIHGRIGQAAGILRPGDIAITDLASPAAFCLAGAEAVHLVVPRHGLPARAAPDTPQPYRRLAADSARGIVLRGLLQTLSETAPVLSPADALTLGACVPDLVTWCLSSAIPTGQDGKATLRRRLRRHIEENLGHRLIPARLAKEFGVSRSQLYRLFAAEGGVAAYVLRRRLRRCRIALCDPALADRRIRDIAFAMGFTDEAYFSRVFRKTYGQSPQEARRAAMLSSMQPPAPQRPASADCRIFHDWLTALGAGG